MSMGAVRAPSVQFTPDPGTGSSKVVSLPDPSRYSSRQTQKRNLHLAGAGVYMQEEASGAYDLVHVQWIDLSDESLLDDLYPFWAHAGKGKPFSWWGDTTQALRYGTLTQGAAKGTFILRVNTVVGFPSGWQLGDQMKVHKPWFGDGAETNLTERSMFSITDEIEFIPFGQIVDLTVTPGLQFTHETGDVVMPAEHYPNVVLMNDEQPWTRKPGGTFDLNFVLRTGALFDVV